MVSHYHLCQQQQHSSPPVYFKSYPIETTLKHVEALKDYIREQIQSIEELKSLCSLGDEIEIRVYKVIAPLQCPSPPSNYRSAASIPARWQLEEGD